MTLKFVNYNLKLNKLTIHLSIEMKILFVFIFALFCLTSIQCSFDPSWQDCSRKSEEWPSWQTTNLTLDKSPVPGQNSTATICMLNPGILTFETEEVQAYSPSYINVYFFDDVALPPGQSHCWNITFPIPEKVPQNLTVQILFRDTWFYFGCGQLNLNFTSSEEKFLSF